MTNGDRIRSMTDEELVYFLTSIEIGSNPDTMVLRANTNEEEWRWKHWLEREAVEWEF